VLLDTTGFGLIAPVLPAQLSRAGRSLLRALSKGGARSGHTPGRRSRFTDHAADRVNFGLGIDCPPTA